MVYQFKVLLTTLAIASIGLPSASADTGTDKQHTCCTSVDPAALVLPSDKMVGDGKAAYEAAKQIPRLCCRLFCYCGCDQVNGHTSLLECFTNDNCGDCPVCDQEVLQALSMSKAGKSLKETQEAIDVNFQNGYFEMFKTPSKAYLEYKKKRLWQPDLVKPQVIKLESD